jgi:hypothetical protein
MLATGQIRSVTIIKWGWMATVGAVGDDDSNVWHILHINKSVIMINYMLGC